MPVTTSQGLNTVRAQRVENTGEQSTIDGIPLSFTVITKETIYS